MNLIKAFLAIPVLVIFLIPFLNSKGKGILLFTAIVLNAVISVYFAAQTLGGNFSNLHCPGA